MVRQMNTMAVSVSAITWALAAGMLKVTAPVFGLHTAWPSAGMPSPKLNVPVRNTSWSGYSGDSSRNFSLKSPEASCSVRYGQTASERPSPSSRMLTAGKSPFWMPKARAMRSFTSVWMRRHSSGSSLWAIRPWFCMNMAAGRRPVSASTRRSSSRMEKVSRAPGST